MKKLFFFLIAASGALSAFAQNVAIDTPKPKKAFVGDSLLPRFVVDVNLLGGVLYQNLTQENTLGNYLNNVNSNVNGKISYDNGMSYGFDGQVGFFFGHKRNFGIGTGFMYLFQQGQLDYNNYHVEFQSTDQEGHIFRQLITANNFNEKLQTTNLNIPLLFKYKKRFTNLLGFTADAGLLFNVKESNSYNSNASFNYEAIYDYDVVNGVPNAVYDNSPTPKSTDVFYTIASYNQSLVHGTVQNYFNTYLPGQGFNVGMGVTPSKNTGTVSYTTGSVGFLVHPAINFFLSDVVALNVGVYYLYQPFTNNAQSGYQLTNKVGEYNSLLNTISNANNQSFGGNVGVRFFIGKRGTPAPPMSVEYVEATNPSNCGSCDGTLTLHGLYANQPVMVIYNMDGSPQPVHNDVVAADGTVKLTGLCAGSYSGITAVIGDDSALATAKTLVAPPMGNISESSTNPTDEGKCDGTITIHGLRQRQAVTVYYNMNGAAQPAFTGNSGTDGTVTMGSLCAGTYSHIVAAINGCSSTGRDVTLTTSFSSGSNADIDELHKISAPILFEVNKTVIQTASMPVLEEAVKMLNKDKTSFIIVDGYTDITGKPAYNKVLSLKRAAAVKTQLEKMGVEPSRIKIEGHGSKSPVGDNSTPEGRKENRRAVMHLNVGE